MAVPDEILQYIRVLAWPGAGSERAEIEQMLTADTTAAVINSWERLSDLLRNRSFEGGRETTRWAFNPEMLAGTFTGRKQRHFAATPGSQ